MSSNELSDYNVLFVDDEIQVLKAIKRGVHLEKYNKFFATSGMEALEIIEKEEIAMIITDMRMPQMDGLALLKQVHKMNPTIVKVILSGYTNLAQIIATINALNIYKFILKPWDIKTELKPIIIEGLKKFEEDIAYKKNIESADKKNELFKKLIATNQQNYEQIHTDFESVKQLQKIIMNYSYFLSLQLKEDKMNKLRLKEELNFIENIGRDFIETLPTLNRITTIKDLQLKIEMIVKNVKEIDFSTNLEVDNPLPINLVHLTWFIDMLFRDILEITVDSIIEININGKYKNGQLKKLEFRIIENHGPANYDLIRKNTIYILSSVFASILKGTLKIEGNDKSIILLTIKI